jgi:hypothetical protein
MQRDVWLQFVRLVRRFAAPVSNRRFTFGQGDIVLVYAWAAYHSRPVYWACDRRNWPDDLRPAPLPSAATMSRRLRRAEILAFLERLRRHLQRGQRRSVLSQLDGKVMAVGPHSGDPDARVGRRSGGWVKGYEFHAIGNGLRRIEAWEVQPLNVDERVVARRLVPRSRVSGYLLADGNYDDNGLHELCDRQGAQLIAPRRRGPHTALGHRAQSAARRRCIELLERSPNGFGPEVHKRRGDIERRFGALSSAWYGIGPLPAWVRTVHRVRLWVATKLVLFQLHQAFLTQRR